MISLLALTAPTHAAEVLIIWDEENGTDVQSITTTLGDAGHVVTLSDTIEYEYDGTNPAPSDFDVVIHLNGDTHATGLPEAGQQALVDFVAGGGAFIHSEWNAYEFGEGRHTLMEDLTLLVRTSGHTANETLYVLDGVEDHPVLAGVPASFELSGNFNRGTVREFDAQPSEQLMEDSSGNPALVVREWEQGRIVAFHHAGAYSSYTPYATSEDLSLLLVNAVDWTTDCDEDDDGFEGDRGFCAAEDCDDFDPALNPGAEELCDGIDNDCDEVVDGPDSSDAVDLYTDADGDGFGDPDSLLHECLDDYPEAVTLSGDCDDADEGANPDAAEIECDGIDQDCDGEDLCEEEEPEDSGDTGESGDDEDGEGCEGCATGSRGGLGWIALLGVGLLLRRRSATS